MPALTGQIIQTLRDASGAKVIEAVIFYTDGTGVLRNATYTTSQGDQTGAVIVDNMLGRGVRVVVRDAAGAELRAVSVPANGVTRTVAQMSALGVTNMSQLNGLTFDLA
jgi:hypothetical protein